MDETNLKDNELENNKNKILLNKLLKKYYNIRKSII